MPTHTRQVERLGPKFNRLQTVLASDQGEMSLRNDPTSIAPERAIVFDVAGDLEEFYRAVQTVPGLEYLFEIDTEFEPDEDFAVIDTRKATKGQARLDKSVGGKVYLAMPDLQALNQLIRLWTLWERERRLPAGFAAWGHVFSQVREIRAWGPQDRISDETIGFWREQLQRDRGAPVRAEVEFWFHQNAEHRARAFMDFEVEVAASNGQIIHHATIEEISYDAALIEIPATQIPELITRSHVHLALADEIMFIRPQSVIECPTEIETAGEVAFDDGDGIADLPPIAALFDGVPVQQHVRLTNRLIIDDPDGLEALTTVTRRVHGTAMASLILHGDINSPSEPLSRKLYVRPLMYGIQDGFEQTQEDRLLVDTVYRAVKRMKEGDAEGAATAPQVFIINLSMGDKRRPFSGPMSPWGRLLDYLSARFGILFLVSAGNILDPIHLPDIIDWTSFVQMSGEERERNILIALNVSKRERTLLSPAESLNVITVGAWHHDNLAEPRPVRAMSLDPFDGSNLPAVISALGLGHRRVVKPDIFFPGGRFLVAMKATNGGGLTVTPVNFTGRHFGLKVASPDKQGTGRLNDTALTAGTSAATALATRAAHQIFDALTADDGPVSNNIDPSFYAVMIKALLVHRANWGEKGLALEELYGPFGQGKHNQRRENVARVLGFGQPTIAEVIECASNRATLVGYGEIIADPEIANTYRIPLPECLARVTDPRKLTLTLAWFSPINTRHQAYRRAKLEAGPVDGVKLDTALGVSRLSQQPTDANVGKGTVLHTHYHGENAVPFIDDGHLVLKVWCRDRAGPIGGEIKYGFAVTIEAETMIPVYEQIQERLRAPVGVRP